MTKANNLPCNFCGWELRSTPPFIFLKRRKSDACPIDRPKKPSYICPLPGCDWTTVQKHELMMHACFTHKSRIRFVGRQPLCDAYWPKLESEPVILPSSTVTSLRHVFSS